MASCDPELCEQVTRVQPGSSGIKVKTTQTGRKGMTTPWNAKELSLSRNSFDS
jgi:hypothetical protein